MVEEWAGGGGGVKLYEQWIFHATFIFWYYYYNLPTIWVIRWKVSDSIVRMGVITPDADECEENLHEHVCFNGCYFFLILNVHDHDQNVGIYNIAHYYIKNASFFLNNIGSLESVASCHK